MTKELTDEMVRYKQMATEFIGWVDQELGIRERAFERSEYNPESMMPLISMVNTVGYFRGEGSAFGRILNEFRDHDAREELAYIFKWESNFENRLAALIQKISASERADEYQQVLTRYYGEARGIVKGRNSG